jgi:DNA polymerase III subunit beta
MAQGISEVLGENGQPSDPFAGNAATPAASYPAFSFSAPRFIFEMLAKRASTVVPSREFQPVLKNFLITVAPASLHVLATDLELSVLAFSPSVTTSFPEGLAKAAVTIPAKRLLAILQEAPDGEVEISVSGDLATVRAGTASWALKLNSDASDYPEIPDIEGCEFHEVKRKAFLDALLAVRYAVSRKGTNPKFMQVSIAPGTDKIFRVVASDSSRFAQVPLPGFPEEIRIPAAGTPSAVDELARMLAASQAETVMVARSGLHLIFKVDSTVLVASMLHHEYPDVDKLLLAPALQNQDKLTVDRRELITALRRVRINADGTTHAIGLMLETGSLTVFSRDTIQNVARETIAAHWEGPKRQLVVNHEYLESMLTAHPSASCSFYLGKDTGKRKSVLLLRDFDTGVTGIINQMAAQGLVGY